MRKPHRFYSLNRPKLRQSWNKYNLFNLSRQVGREPQIKGMPTFFQQKWAAKARTRAYHGEYIPEKKWVRLFSRRLLSAVELPPEYLAANDGSEQATGRGSGLTTSTVMAESYSKVPKIKVRDLRESGRRSGLFGDVNKMLSEQFTKMTPYMQMTFAPLERRLDTAVFRALFASSVRQARQFVIHGAVTVNGKKMVHPSYALNPGDMFQVDIDKVMYGTGQQKQAHESKRFREHIEAREKKADAFYQRAFGQAAGANTTEEPAQNMVAGDGGEKMNEAPADGAAAAGSAGQATESSSAEAAWKASNRALKYLLKNVRGILKNNVTELRAKEKKTLRLFRADALRLLSHPKDSEVEVQKLMNELQQRMKSHELMRNSFEKLGLQRADEASEAGPEDMDEEQQARRAGQIEKDLAGLSEEQKEKATRIMGSSQLSREEIRKLGWLLKRDEENPVDESKPYATPWRPRPFMSAFAFIPRYLEVNPNICAAVYIRHPVARKGMAEVPTPFSYLTSQLTHNWYLGRG